MVKIALLIMVKDEAKRIQVTLDSTVGTVDLVIVYDTGSTDATLNIIREHCTKQQVPLHIKEGSFVDYSTSRNISLDFADNIDEDYDYLLLMDANDELRGGEILRAIAEKELPEARVAYFVQQQLDRNGSINSFFNVRVLKRWCGWRYEGSVHESFEVNSQLSLTGKLPEVILYQDRTEDADKSAKRFARDRELLLKDHQTDPNNPRTVYYLAQTCDSMHEYDEAYRYHKLRAHMPGSMEEKFLSTFRVGFLSRDLEEGILWYLKAYAIQNRAEPLLKISEYYYRKKMWILAYHFAKASCELEYPGNAFMYVDQNAYNYIRWTQLAITSFPAKQFDEGLKGALQAYNATGATQDELILKKYQEVLGIQEAQSL